MAEACGNRTHLARVRRHAGFEDQEGHQAQSASRIVRAVKNASAAGQKCSVAEAIKTYSNSLPMSRLFHDTSCWGPSIPLQARASAPFSVVDSIRSPDGLCSGIATGRFSLANPVMIVFASGTRSMNSMPIPGGKDLRLGRVGPDHQTTHIGFRGMPDRVSRTCTSRVSGGGCWVLMTNPPPQISWRRQPQTLGRAREISP